MEYTATFIVYMWLMVVELHSYITIITELLLNNLTYSFYWGIFFIAIGMYFKRNSLTMNAITVARESIRTR